MNKGFNITLILNYMSLGLMAISGLLMNTVIAAYYGAEVLGIFSETYAWYLIISQLAVWGIHMAIVKMVPEETDDKKRGAVLKTGLILVILSSLLITGISEGALLFMADLPWQHSMQIAFTGLMLFSVNKVLLNYLNAVSRMNAYALFISLRYLCFGLIIVIESWLGLTPDYLAVVFPGTEIIVFFAMATYFVAKEQFIGKAQKNIAGKMMYFGTKIIPSYMVMELNTKVDVVCLGALANDVSQIGIYSFAVFFTEGFYMFYVTIRKIINPDISKANVENNLEERISEINSGLNKYTRLGGTTAFLGIMAVYFITCLIFGRIEYGFGIVYIAVIGLSILINGKSIIFGDLLAQTGLPLDESILNIVTVGANFILNIILIFLFGTMGAAVATAISYFIFNWYMKWRVRRRIRISI